MASLATNGDAMAALEDIQAPPGVVLPPKEIKGASSPCHIRKEHQLTSFTAILEKTAGYVARNGFVFEGRSLISPPGRHS
jgi:splicing factor 3A subunit 1